MCIWNSKQDILKSYNLSKYLAIDKGTVLFKERVVFKQYIKNKFQQKIKLCDSIGYIYDMKVYLGKARHKTWQLHMLQWQRLLGK